MADQIEKTAENEFETEVETAAETEAETNVETGAEANAEPDVKTAAEADAKADAATTAPSRLRPFHIAGIVLAALALVAGTIGGFAIPARPSESILENRTLAEFPEFDVDSLLSGKYFSEIELWFSDTYPIRDDLVSVSRTIESLYGIVPEVAFTGGDVVADELPPAEVEEEEPPAPKHYEFEPVPMPEGSEWGADITEALLRGLYTEDGICYGIFYFNKAAADRYTAAINLCAELLEGECEVYSMLAPMNSIYLDQELIDSFGGSNQTDALAYYNRQFADNVYIVDTLDTLLEHGDEYLYFGTDHHWTMRGAYYAYLEFCDVKGIEPEDALNDWEFISYGPFQGSYATGLDGKAVLEADTVEAWINPNTNDQVYWDWDGTLEPKGKFYVINDLNAERKSSGHYTDMYKHENAAGFSTFGGGDWGLVRVDNPNLHDGSTLLIVKDSYADALYPLMISHYEHVYVMDFRYFDYNIPQFAREYGVDDILFVNCLAVTSASTAADILWNRVVDDTMVKLEEDPEAEAIAEEEAAKEAGELDTEEPVEETVVTPADQNATVPGDTTTTEQSAP